ncbi:MAG TPA: DUF481 domain-containing protein [Gemmatimonadales bacterium]|jgi:putative salt-induced outer membrane protein YdiY
MMTMNRRGAVLVLVFLAAGASAAMAQAPADTLGWHFTGSLGYVQTSGNTRLSTVNLGDKLVSHPSHSWTFTQLAAVIYGRSGDSTSANQLSAGLRADFNINLRLSAFGTGTYEANPFAGLSHRQVELLGLSWKALDQAHDVVTIDLGGGETQERKGRVDANFAVAHFAPDWRHTFHAKTYFEEALTMEENLKSTGSLRTTSQSTLSAPLTRTISLALGLLLKYDAQPALIPPPAPAGTYYKKLDTTFTSGIQITL